MKLRKLVENLRIDNKVVLKLFRISDLLALVSYTENFGYVAVEAMAAKVPVLLSENVGVCDAVREDGPGLVVPVDEEAIANALMRDAF